MISWIKPMNEVKQSLVLLIYYKTNKIGNLYITITKYTLAAILKMAAILNFTNCVSIDFSLVGYNLPMCKI